VDNTADINVKGSEVSGAVGDQVTATVTVKNRGPAWVASLGAGSSVVLVDVRVPQGTTVVGKPDRCSAVTPDGQWPESQLGAPRYLCRTPIYLWEKDRVDFPFELRIDQVVEGVRGAVSTVEDNPDVPLTAFDPDLDNNSAAIVVNG
jgi:hypothetical protein